MRLAQSFKNHYGMLRLTFWVKNIFIAYFPCCDRFLNRFYCMKNEGYLLQITSDWVTLIIACLRWFRDKTCSYLQQIIPVFHRVKWIQLQNVTRYSPGRSHFFELIFFRLQNEAEYEKIWSEVRKILNDGDFPVKMADTMSGKDEATFSWTTVNQLLGNKVRWYDNLDPFRRYE